MATTGGADAAAAHNANGEKYQDFPSYYPNSSSSILTGIRYSLGTDMLEGISKTKVLVVGAGGIGCELIKNLALCGFQHVEIIDLDTIDVSNLNRQLLFRSRHVGQPKCIVACHVALDYLVPTNNSDGKKDSHYQYMAHHGNVCDNSFFNVAFVSQFDVVLNALDNVTARRRVNRMCLAANNGMGIPMIEAGTTGYLGQVTVVQRSHVQCYECRPQQAPKVYPICTIRSTPSLPVHTIVWSKECYKLLFHPNVQESMLYEDDYGNNNADENGDVDNTGGSGEPSVFMGAVMEYRKDRHDHSTNESAPASSATAAAATATNMNGDGHYHHHGAAAKFPSKDSRVDDPLEAQARQILQTLYHDEIIKQLNMNRYKTAQKRPQALDQPIIQGATAAKAPSANPDAYSTTRVWTVEECASEFVKCLVEASSTNNGSVVPIEFDKDDDLAMRFVTAACNLRNHVFGITPLQSYYSAKGIAGNIIPAIATTNAIVAGLQILQVFHVLRAQLDHRRSNKSLKNDESVAPRYIDNCRYINCVRQASRNGLYLIASPLEAPNPECFVCRNATLHLHLNLENNSVWTLQELIERVLKSQLGFVEPAILLDDGGSAVWEEGEDEFVQNATKKLQDLPCGGIRHGTVMLVEDYSQDMSVEIVVSHCDTWPKSDEETEGGDEDDDNSFRFLVGGNKPVVAGPAAPTAAATATPSNGGVSGPPEDSDDDDIVEISEEADSPTSSRKKRTLSEGSLDGKPPAKKQFQAKVLLADCEVIEIDD